VKDDIAVNDHIVEARARDGSDLADKSNTTIVPYSIPPHTSPLLPPVLASELPRHR
jgi:hypothetical protein